MFLRFAIAFFLAILVLSPAEAKRVALVIGNNSYPNLPDFRQLQKAVNDARSMRDTLRDDLGFEVSFAEDADFRTMNNGFKTFEAVIEPGDIVFLYFSGHGVSIGGENFLLPSDIPKPVLGEEQRLIGSSFGAEQLVLRLKKRGARAIFTVLDACRDDPFESENGKAVGGPSGLTKMDAAEGVFILFAAGVRQEALDRLHDADPNPNSLFTRSLIPALKTAGLSQVDLAKRVYKEVKAAAATIGHEQTPAYYDQIDGYVMLKEGEVKVPETDPNADGKTALAAAGDDVGMLKVVTKRFEGTIWADFAASKIEKLEKQVAVLEPAKPVEPACTGVTTKVRGAEKCLSIKENFTDCDGCPEMVVIPAGSFMMGSPEGEVDRGPDEGPQHSVTFDKAFAVGKFEVTLEQFKVFVSETNYDAVGECIIRLDGGVWESHEGKSYLDPDFKQADNSPVTCVSWDDAQAYTNWLAKKTGVGYRLLTESEWEYAIRAGTTSTFLTGEKIAPEQANFDLVLKATAAVGSYSPNGFGLFDMAGNVAEWTEDVYYENYNNADAFGTAATGESSGRVHRGGGWERDANGLRSANREVTTQFVRGNYIGIRLARGL